MRKPSVIALTFLVLLDALGWGFGVLSNVRHILTHRSLPTVNIPLVGNIRALSGPFEALGVEFVAASALLFVVVSFLKLIAAYWIWNLRRDGTILQLILSGISAIFWYGFALPFGPPWAIAETIVMAISWKNYR